MKLYFGFLILSLLASSCKKDIWEGRFDKERKLKKAFRSKEGVDLLYGEQIKIWNVQAGETVVEMGAYDGVMAGLISLYSDSAEIYIQDVDTSNFYIFRDPIRPYFEDLKGRPFTNAFKFVKGDYDTTHLPPDTFNKVLVNNVLEYVIKGWYTPEEELDAELRAKADKMAKEDFLREMHLILKDSGFLYVRIPIARNEQEEQFLFSENKLVNLITQQKFKFISDHEVMQGMNYIYKFQKSDRNGRIRYN